MTDGRIAKDLEGNSRALISILSQHLLRGTIGSHERKLKIDRVPV
jgi:hypothetical protein